MIADTMALKRNKKIFFVLLLVAMVMYWWSRPTPHSQRLARYYADHLKKERHPASYYLKKVQTNDTIFANATSHNFHHPGSKAALEYYLRPEKSSFPFTKPEPKLIERPFNIDEDVFVYLHIQKVGGTSFNSHLINDLKLDTPCNCKADVITNPCYCKTKKGFVWLFSWFTVGWPCELHADWTMLHECVDKAMNEIEGFQRKRRYLYITLLRDPVARFLSEWQHLRSGSHWKDGKLRCAQQEVSLFDLRPCFNELTWEGVTFVEFMDCQDNLARNRQTRMMADLTKSQCYDRRKIKPDVRSRLQLTSALENIANIEFFGLTEYQKETKELFEKTFHVEFQKEFELQSDKEWDEMISEDEFIQMMKYIELDVQLYLYAKSLFSTKCCPDKKID